MSQDAWECVQVEKANERGLDLTTRRRNDLEWPWYMSLLQSSSSSQDFGIYWLKLASAHRFPLYPNRPPYYHRHCHHVQKELSSLKLPSIWVWLLWVLQVLWVLPLLLPEPCGVFRTVPRGIINADLFDWGIILRLRARNVHIKVLPVGGTHGGWELVVRVAVAWRRRVVYIDWDLHVLVMTTISQRIHQSMSAQNLTPHNAWSPITHTLAVYVHHWRISPINCPQYQKL